MESTNSIKNHLLEQVTKQTGYPVEIVSDSNLKVRASMRSARGNIRLHTIMLNPQYSTQSDYWIAVQCFHLLRMWTVPRDLQYDFKPNEAILPKLIRDLNKIQIYTTQAKSTIESMANHFFSGILLQLRSIPIELRINEQIIEQFPPLIGQQRSAVVSMLQENSQSLSPQIKQIAPSYIYNSSISINAAYALFWSKHWDDDTIISPYKSQNMLHIATDLLQVLNVFPNQNGLEDISIIDEWGDILDMSEWYTWVKRL